MIITKENNEIIIRIPESETGLSLKDVQDLIDYLTYRTIVNKSQASQEQIDELAREVNSSWWKKNKDRFLDS